MNAKRLVFVLVVVLALLLVSACARQESTPACGTCNTDSSINNSNSVIVNVDANGQGSAANGENTSTEATAEVSTFVAPNWDNTCVKQSEVAGVTLTPLAEGSFIACVWHGKGKTATVTIDNGYIADVDLGAIYVAKGLTVIDNVANITIRPMRTGTDAEACAQVDALTFYGQSLPKQQKFEAQPYNFVCP